MVQIFTSQFSVRERKSPTGSALLVARARLGTRGPRGTQAASPGSRAGSPPGAVDYFTDQDNEAWSTRCLAQGHVTSKGQGCDVSQACSSFHFPCAKLKLGQLQTSTQTWQVLVSCMRCHTWVKVASPSEDLAHTPEPSGHGRAPRHSPDHITQAHEPASMPSSCHSLCVVAGLPPGGSLFQLGPPQPPQG